MNLKKPYETFGTPKYKMVFRFMEFAFSGWPRALLYFCTLLIHFFEMPSTVDICKRALVILIRALAVAYGFRVAVTRDSADQVIKRAYHTARSNPPRPPARAEKERDLFGESLLGFLAAPPFR